MTLRIAAGHPSTEPGDPVYVTKKSPGASSHGYQWPAGGEFVEMTPDEAHELVCIQPGEFEAVPDLPKGAKAYVAPVPGAPETIVEE